MIGTAEQSVSISMLKLSREVWNPPAVQRSPTPDASDRTYPMHPAGAQEKHQWSAQHISAGQKRSPNPVVLNPGTRQRKTAACNAVRG